MSNSPNDGLTERVNNLDRAVFGDRYNPKETPGIISELAQMNTTMTELRDAVRKIGWSIITAFITALCVIVFKGIN